MSPKIEDPAAWATVGPKIAFEAAQPAGVIRIDPGIDGALALLSTQGGLIDVAAMPVLPDGSGGRAAVNAPLLAELLARWYATTVIREYVSARPTDGYTAAFSFGRCRGLIEGTCAAFGLPIAFVTAPQWRRLVGLTAGRDGTKDAARSEAIRRWRDKAGLFARVKDDGRAEAALIGLVGLLQERDRWRA